MPASDGAGVGDGTPSEGVATGVSDGDGSGSGVTSGGVDPSDGSGVGSSGGTVPSEPLDWHAATTRTSDRMAASDAR